LTRCQLGQMHPTSITRLLKSGLFTQMVGIGLVTLE